MKANWKRLFVWSSLGGLALSATVSLARKSRRTTPLLVYRKIPSECRKISLWTERFQVQEGDKQCLVYESYLLQATPFRLWNVIDLPISSGPTSQEGVPIYHVTLRRHIEIEQEREEAPAEERFYGVISALNSLGKSAGSSCIARGGLLEIRKCYVGGASNGVETGEIHRSSAPVLNYRFEYSDPSSD